MWGIVALFSFVVLTPINGQLTGTFERCTIDCSNSVGDTPLTGNTRRGLRGKSGPRGSKGEPGISCDVARDEIEELQSRIAELENLVNNDRSSNYPNKELVTFGGGGEINECQFPFLYYDVLYYGCTNHDEGAGQYWCSTTAEYDGKWRYCKVTGTNGYDFVDLSSNSAEVVTFGGQGHLDECEFPFQYEGVNYYSCTNYNEGAGQYWCSTTAEYDGKWKYCKPLRIP